MVLRIYFSDSENINEFISKLEECIAFNGISDKNVHLDLKCSLKDDTLFWLEKISPYPVTDKTQRYNKTVGIIEKGFTCSKGLEYITSRILLR